MKAKKTKKYTSEIVKNIQCMMVLLVVYAAIAHLFVTERFITGILITSLFISIFLPVALRFLFKDIDLAMGDKAIIDVRLCDYKYLLSTDVDDVWSTAMINQSEIVNCEFVEINNISEKMATSFKIIVNHDKDKKNINYIIPYTLKKGGFLYFAISPKDTLSNITVITYTSNRVGMAKSFYGNRSKAKDHYVFSEATDTDVRVNEKPIDRSSIRMGLQKELLSSESQSKS